MEILSPCGSMNAFYAAIEGGCDAVYLAGKMFGARSFANNFTNEELVQVINYAHLYGVKIYVTINTIIYESEITGWDPAVAGRDPVGGYICSVCKEEAVYDCNDFAVTVNQIISTLYFRDAGSYQEVYTVCGVKTIIVHNKTAGLRFFPFRPVPLSREETFNNISDGNIPQNRPPVNRQNK